MIKILPSWDSCLAVWFSNDVLELVQPSLNENEIETFMKFLCCVFMKSSNELASSIDAATWASNWTHN